MSMDQVRFRSAELKEELSEITGWLTGIAAGGFCSPEKMTDMRFRFGQLQLEQQELYTLICLNEQMSNETPETVVAHHEALIRAHQEA